MRRRWQCMYIRSSHASFVENFVTLKEARALQYLKLILQFGHVLGGFLFLSICRNRVKYHKVHRLPTHCHLIEWDRTKMLLFLYKLYVLWKGESSPKVILSRDKGNGGIKKDNINIISDNSLQKRNSFRMSDKLIVWVIIVIKTDFKKLFNSENLHLLRFTI